jgi:sarcosine oxidase subunit alpha
MLASAVQRYAELYGVACGRRVLLAAACDSVYGVAHALHAAGIEVAAIVDQRAEAAAAGPAGVPIHRASAIVAVQGGRAVAGATVISHDGR